MNDPNLDPLISLYELARRLLAPEPLPEDLPIARLSEIIARGIALAPDQMAVIHPWINDCESREQKNEIYIILKALGEKISAPNASNTSDINDMKEVYQYYLIKDVLQTEGVHFLTRSYEIFKTIPAFWTHFVSRTTQQQGKRPPKLPEYAEWMNGLHGLPGALTITPEKLRHFFEGLMSHGLSEAAKSLQKGLIQRPRTEQLRSLLTNPKISPSTIKDLHNQIIRKSTDIVDIRQEVFSFFARRLLEEKFPEILQPQQTDLGSGASSSSEPPQKSKAEQLAESLKGYLDTLYPLGHELSSQALGSVLPLIKDRKKARAQELLKINPAIFIPLPFELDLLVNVLMFLIQQRKITSPPELVAFFDALRFPAIFRMLASSSVYHCLPEVQALLSGQKSMSAEEEAQFKKDALDRPGQEFNGRPLPENIDDGSLGTGLYPLFSGNSLFGAGRQALLGYLNTLHLVSRDSLFFSNTSTSPDSKKLLLQERSLAMHLQTTSAVYHPLIIMTVQYTIDLSQSATPAQRLTFETLCFHEQGQLWFVGLEAFIYQKIQQAYELQQDLRLLEPQELLEIIILQKYLNFLPLLQLPGWFRNYQETFMPEDQASLREWMFCLAFYYPSIFSLLNIEWRPWELSALTQRYGEQALGKTASIMEAPPLPAEPLNNADVDTENLTGNEASEAMPTPLAATPSAEVAPFDPPPLVLPPPPIMLAPPPSEGKSYWQEILDFIKDINAPLTSPLLTILQEDPLAYEILCTLQILDETSAAREVSAKINILSAQWDRTSFETQISLYLGATPEDRQKLIQDIAYMRALIRGLNQLSRQDLRCLLHVERPIPHLVFGLIQFTPHFSEDLRTEVCSRLAIYLQSGNISLEKLYILLASQTSFSLEFLRELSKIKEILYQVTPACKSQFIPLLILLYNLNLHQTPFGQSVVTHQLLRMILLAEPFEKIAPIYSYYPFDLIVGQLAFVTPLSCVQKEYIRQETIDLASANFCRLVHEFYSENTDSTKCKTELITGFKSEDIQKLTEKYGPLAPHLILACAGHLAPAQRPWYLIDLISSLNQSLLQVTPTDKNTWASLFGWQEEMFIRLLGKLGSYLPEQDLEAIKFRVTRFLANHPYLSESQKIQATEWMITQRNLPRQTEVKLRAILFLKPQNNESSSQQISVRSCQSSFAFAATPLSSLAPRQPTRALNA